MSSKDIGAERLESSWENSSVLVTGGAGFIGSHLTRRLVELGADVVVADNRTRGEYSRLSDIINKIEFLPVDLTTHKGSLQAVQRVDYVFHLAASVGGIHYIQRNNVGGLTPNVLMNQHMLEAARISGIERFLYASSACIYRQQHDKLNIFNEEEGIPADPHSTYGWAKILGEIACQAYQEDDGLNTSIVRIFNCYGPHESLDPDSSHVIPSLCRKVIEEPDGGSIELFGDGTQERGFIYVTDLVAGMLKAIRKKADSDPINLGDSTEVVSMNELAQRIISISGKDISLEHNLSMPTGTDKYAADMEKMKRELEWKPSVPLNEGLRRTYQWAESELETKVHEPLHATDGGERK